jgi:hypothetical protein
LTSAGPIEQEFLYPVVLTVGDVDDASMWIDLRPVGDAELARPISGDSPGGFQQEALSNGEAQPVLNG